MKILIAEDEPVARLALARTIEAWGFHVTPAGDGAEALQMFKADPVAMIITDWMMPGMDGPQLCREIRKLPCGKYAYVIILTSRSSKKSLVEGITAGADDFVAKPFEPEELLARIRAGQRILDLQDELHARISQLDELNRTIAESNRQMKADLDAAAAAQRAMLPTQLPQTPKVTFAWEYRPCTELGGDCLNIFQLGHNHVAMYVLDVSGHGVQAALLSVTLSRMLSPSNTGASILTKTNDDTHFSQLVAPKEVADLLNQRFPLDTNTGQYFTLLYGLLNLETGELRYVTAGHPGPIHFPQNGIPRILEGYGMPIGFCENPEYAEHSVFLSPGDRLYLFTDGVIEVQDTQNHQFGDGGVVDTLKSCRNAPLAESLRCLIDSVVSWARTPELPDDIAMLAVEFLPQSVRRTSRSSDGIVYAESMQWNHPITEVSL